MGLTILLIYQFQWNTNYKKSMTKETLKYSKIRIKLIIINFKFQLFISCPCAIFNWISGCKILQIITFGLYSNFTDCPKIFWNGGYRRKKETPENPLETTQSLSSFWVPRSWYLETHCCLDPQTFSHLIPLYWGKANIYPVWYLQNCGTHSKTS